MPENSFLNRSQHKLSLGTKKNRQVPEVLVYWWALTDSNRRPSACKADALNQLS